MGGALLMPGSGAGGGDLFDVKGLGVALDEAGPRRATLFARKVGVAASLDGRNNV